MARRKGKSKNPRLDRIKEQLRAQAGLDRQAFFASGGEMVRWRGLHIVFSDKKKKANRRACRKKVNY